MRGVVATDALIGTFAPPVDAALDGNRCFLYHVIGGGTGDWDVPVGGMGTVSGALWRAAVEAGAELVADAEVTAVTPDGEVTYRHGDSEHVLAAGTVLSGVAPYELARLMGSTGVRPEGAQVKVNLLLSRLPRLRDSSVDPVAAFGGTFHANEGWARLAAVVRGSRRREASRIPYRARSTATRSPTRASCRPSFRLRERRPSRCSPCRRPTGW